MILENGTKVWVVDNSHPECKLLEGEIDRYNPQQINNTDEVLEYYVVYIAEYDRSFRYHRDWLYLDRTEAVQARIDSLNTLIRYEKEYIEEYTQDIEHIQNDIYDCRTKISKLEKLIADEYRAFGTNGN